MIRILHKPDHYQDDKLETAWAVGE